MGDRRLEQHDRGVTVEPSERLPSARVVAERGEGRRGHGRQGPRPAHHTRAGRVLAQCRGESGDGRHHLLGRPRALSQSGERLARRGVQQLRDELGAGAERRRRADDRQRDAAPLRDFDGEGRVERRVWRQPHQLQRLADPRLPHNPNAAFRFQLGAQRLPHGQPERCLGADDRTQHHGARDRRCRLVTAREGNHSPHGNDRQRGPDGCGPATPPPHAGGGRRRTRGPLDDCSGCLGRGGRRCGPAGPGRLRRQLGA